jgi:hypothetical protein
MAEVASSGGREMPMEAEERVTAVDAREWRKGGRGGDRKAATEREVGGEGVDRDREREGGRD